MKAVDFFDRSGVHFSVNPALVAALEACVAEDGEQLGTTIYMNTVFFTVEQNIYSVKSSLGWPG